MRKYLCIVLVWLVCFFSLCGSPATVFAEDDTNATDLQNRQQELQNQINNATGELNDVQDELSSNLQQVQKLDEKIESSQSSLEELNNKITELQNTIDDVGSKLKVAEDTYNSKRKLLEKRLVAMYEAGETRYLDFILSSNNISDFLSSYYLITILTNYDNQLLQDVEERKNSIESQKKQLDTTQEQLAVVKENQTRTARILENTKSVRENFISKLSDKEKNIQAQIDEYNRQFAEVNAEILKLAQDGLDTKYIGGVLEWPVPGYTRISSKYGMRTHPITGVYKLHTGVDIAAPLGAEFIAANDGIVVKASYNGAYGNMVMIDHGGGVSTLYAHGSEILVKVGQTVKRGDPILKVGSTGYSTGPHAHFEVRLNGKVTDPMPYITNGLIPDANNTANTEETQKD